MADLVQRSQIPGFLVGRAATLVRAPILTLGGISFYLDRLLARYAKEPAAADDDFFLSLIIPGRIVRDRALRPDEVPETFAEVEIIHALRRITQRGNRRQQTFFCDDDFRLYKAVFLCRRVIDPFSPCGFRSRLQQFHENRTKRP